MYSGIKNSSKIEIEKAIEREHKKIVKYNEDTNYIIHFKMAFEKDRVKLKISEDNYINIKNVPYNEVTRSLERDYNGKPNIYADWDRLESNENLLEFTQKHHIYPVWIKYDWIDGKIVYNNKYLKIHREAVLENLKLNMEFYNKLDKTDFNNKLNAILKMKVNRKIKEVSDLKDFIGIKGIYIMVLDKYKQVYVGQSKRDVVKRIIQHWSRKIEFENLLTGEIDNSKLPIDSFGILDTTRIFIEEVNVLNLDSREEELVDLIPEEYLINLVGGGIKLDNSIQSGFKFANTYKRRKLR